jgi:hypothetical protein
MRQVHPFGIDRSPGALDRSFGCALPTGVIGLASVAVFGWVPVTLRLAHVKSVIAGVLLAVVVIQLVGGIGAALGNQLPAHTPEIVPEAQRLYWLTSWANVPTGLLVLLAAGLTALPGPEGTARQNPTDLMRRWAVVTAVLVAGFAALGIWNWFAAPDLTQTGRNRLYSLPTLTANVSGLMLAGLAAWLVLRRVTRNQAHQDAEESESLRPYSA